MKTKMNAEDERFPRTRYLDKYISEVNIFYASAKAKRLNHQSQYSLHLGVRVHTDNTVSVVNSRNAA